jgi:enoyl-CoA hydratase
MKLEQVQQMVVGNAGFIIFDAPGTNLLTRVSFERISSILDDYDHNPSIDAIVFYGVNGNFCGGVNLKWMQSLQQRPEIGKETIDYIYRIGLRISESKKPTIAAIENGICGGVGFELAMLCEYVVAMKKNASDIIFNALAIRFGFMLGLGVSWRLAHKIGARNAVRFLLNRHSTGLTGAYRLGIVDELLLGDDFTEEVCRFVKLVSAKKRPEMPPPITPEVTLRELKDFSSESSVSAVFYTLRALRTIARAENFRDALALDRIYFENLFFSENAKEGISAFLENRPPRFAGGMMKDL